VGDSRGEGTGVFARHGYLSETRNGKHGTDLEKTTGEVLDTGVNQGHDEPSPTESPARSPDTPASTPANEEKRTWIRSTHPLVVEYCRRASPRGS